MKAEYKIVVTDEQVEVICTNQEDVNIQMFKKINNVLNILHGELNKIVKS